MYGALCFDQKPQLTSIHIVSERKRKSIGEKQFIKKVDYFQKQRMNAYNMYKDVTSMTFG